MTTSEADLIGRLREAASRLRIGSGIRLGIGDDTAIFAPRSGYETILTCDWFLEGTHFGRDMHPPDAVGWKCLARAVSDVAAMGGRPRCFLLSLALPETLAEVWFDKFLAGLRLAARKLNCPLIGGDTTRQPQVLINVTVVGEVRSACAVLRSGARAGDILYVSGRLGEADLGLQLLRSKGRFAKHDPTLIKHLYPEPRVALGRWLADQRLATSMMDLSDGLSTDLPRLCRASGVGARIDAMAVPAVRVPKRNGGRKIDALNLALNGGDDYELLFAVRPAQARRLPRTFRGLPLTAIGTITRERRVRMICGDGREEPLEPRGWDPFRK
jgi:thiamine-monophosphate kinase